MFALQWRVKDIFYDITKENIYNLRTGLLFQKKTVWPNFVHKS
jgi:hypothetical protein